MDILINLRVFYSPPRYVFAAAAGLLLLVGGDVDNIFFMLSSFSSNRFFSMQSS